MTTAVRPNIRPERPHFSSGPCRKHPGWSAAALEKAVLGRSHRAAPARERLMRVITESRDILGIPDDYRVAIVPGSDTGAVEMALWSLLGPCGVDAFAWENFGKQWIIDVREQLRLQDLRLFEAPYGELPDLRQAAPDRDVVFTWNGTTSGVCVPNGDWIAADRTGLTICDATSAMFAFTPPWDKLDVTTWSWQKTMGGEAAHGMLVLSPRAVERLESHTPGWPMPKVFRLTRNGKLNEDIFQARTINTVSMMSTEDALSSLCWIRSIGGLSAMIARSDESLGTVRRWVAARDWIEFFCREPAHQSNAAICLRLTESCGLSGSAKDNAPRLIAELLEREGVALDINNHPAAPPSLRLWAGGTVDPSDIAALLPWIDWAWGEVRRAA